jgi:hypothetical protein
VEGHPNQMANAAKLSFRGPAIRWELAVSGAGDGARKENR